MELDLTIVVPAFNESERLGEGMKRFQAAADDGAIDLETTEILLVDDGSDDGTADVARSLLAPLPHHRVVSLGANAGKGAAVRTGVSLSTSPYTAYMDADMAIDPRSVPDLVAALATNDVAIGSRALPESMVDGTYALRSVMGRGFNRLVTTGTRLDLLDTQCGFKGFRTPAARLLFHLVRIDRFAFDVEVLARARRLGFRIAQIPVHWKHVPGSTIHPVHDSLSMLIDVYRSRLGLVPPPQITAVEVRDIDQTATASDAPEGGGGSDSLASRVADVAISAIGGMPLPVVEDGRSVLVLLPLADAIQSGTVCAALREAFSPIPVFRRGLSAEALRTLGPQTGRLDERSGHRHPR